MIKPAHLISPIQLTALQKKYPPRLTSHNELTSLLEDINRSRPLIQLSVSAQDNICLIEGIDANIVDNISVLLATRTFQGEIETRLHQYLGQPDSATLHDQIQTEISTYLKSRGFYQVSSAMSSTNNDDNIQLIIHIDEGYPCAISKIVTEFTPPFSTGLNIKVNDICDEEQITNTLNDFHTQILDLGYNNAQMLKPSLQYDPSDNSAILYISGSINKKVKYKVVSSRGPIIQINAPVIDPSITDPDIMRTETLRNYRELGYDDAIVEFSGSKDTNKDEITHVFTVLPGTKYFISQLQIEGSHAFTADECLNIMQLNKTLNINAIPLNTDFIRSGVDALTSAYNQQGYWDAKISFPRITKNSSSGEAKLVFTIEEGKQRIFEAMVLRGVISIPHEEITQLFPISQGKPLNWQDLANFEKELKLYYIKQGYLNVKVSSEIKDQADDKEIKSTIFIIITENHRIRIGDITIVGLVKTKPIVVKRELRFSTGNFYNPEELDQTKRSLTKLGLFSSIDITPSTSASLSESSEIVPYDVILRETKPGTISFGPGYSFDEGGRFQVEYAYKNIGGLGRQFYARSGISEEYRQYSIGNDKTMLGRTIGLSYVEPYVLETPIDGTVVFSHKAEAGHNWEISNSGEFSLQHTLRRFLPDTTIGGFYGQKLTTTQGREELKVNLIETGSIRTGTIGFKVTTDQRDNVTWPKKGYIFGAEIAWARYPFGGALQYNKWAISHSAYRSLSEKFTLAGGYNLITFDNIAQEGRAEFVLPTSERLYSGGAEDNRGFNREDLGAIIRQYDTESQSFDNIIIGGSRRGYYKFELRYLYKPDFVAFSLFTDASNSFFSQKEQKIFENTFAETAIDSATQSKIFNNTGYFFEEILTDPSILWRKNYISSGLATNFLTPLGSINLSYGIPLKRYPAPNCNAQTCIPRGRESKNRLTSGVFHVNISASF